MRQKVYDSLYWKQECFGLTAEGVVAKAAELKYVGGMHGQPQKPSEFLCLALKLLQIAPERGVVLEFVRNEDFKYLRLLGAFYLRLVARPAEIYATLEPLLLDSRRVRRRDLAGRFSLWHVDEAVDALLSKERVYDVALPRLTPRHVLEETGDLPPRESPLQDEFEALWAREEAEREAQEAVASARAFLATEEQRASEAGEDEERRASAAGEAEERRERPRAPSPWRLSREERRARVRRSPSRSVSRDRGRRERGRERHGDEQRRDERRRSRREDEGGRRSDDRDWRRDDGGRRREDGGRRDHDWRRDERNAWSSSRDDRRSQR